MSETTTLIDPVSGRSWDVPNNRLEPWHVVTIKLAGWRLTHPITCLLDECEFNAIAERWIEPPARVGTYRWMEPDGNWIEDE